MSDASSRVLDLDLLRLAVSPGEAARISGLGRTTLYAAIGSGALRSLKVGKRRLITIEALKDWLAAAELSANRGNDAR
jgi:excisionase family DNA binding protein